MTKTETTRTTAELVRLPGGAVRTVSRITDAGYVNSRNLPIRVVHYVEAADGPSIRGTWSSVANTSADASVWVLA